MANRSHTPMVTNMLNSSADADDFRAAVDAATDGLAMTDKEGRYVYLNRSHIDMFGFHESELLGFSWRTIYTPEEASRLEQEALPEVLRSGSWRGEANGRHKDGSTVYQEVVLTLHPKGGLICATRDVSKRREEERRTRLLEARLRIAERSEVLFSLRSSLAHDFGNLIAAIDGFARLIQQSDRWDSLNRSRVQSILKASEQAFELIREMAPDSDGVSSAPTLFDLVAVLDAGVVIANSLKADTVSISKSVLPRRALVLGSDVLAARCLLNVIKNAIEAVDVAGAVQVRLQTEVSAPLPGASVRSLGAPLGAARWVVEIEDNGEGMSADRLDSVLAQRFSTKQGSGPRGLGLESVIALAETGLVGIEIQSSLGTGTRFVFRFVDADEALVEDRRDAPLAPIRKEAKPRVFVVDDNELVASMLMQTLSEAGFEAAYALNGTEALAQDISSIDAVVTDFRMPGMDGHELARNLKAMRPGLPIIIYSAQGGHIAHGPMFDAVLSKPVDPARLVSAVRGAVKCAMK